MESLGDGMQMPYDPVVVVANPTKVQAVLVAASSPGKDFSA